MGTILASILWRPILTAAFLASLATPAACQTSNLALGATYEWEPPPNNQYCTDPGDAQQLTDGHRIRDNRGWTTAPMVGWSLRLGQRVQLTFDLRDVFLVESVTVSTRHAADSEVLPPSILVGTSTDGETFTWGGALDSRHYQHNPRPGSRKIDLTVTLEVEQAAQWVHLAFTLQEDFLVTDEVEIHGRRMPDAARAPTQILPEAQYGRARTDRMVAQQRRLWALRHTLPGQLEAQHLFPQCSVPTEETERYRQRAARWKRDSGLDRRQVIGIQRTDPMRERSPWSPPGPVLTDTLRIVSGEWGAIAADIWTLVDTSLACGSKSSHTSVRSTLRHAAAVETRDATWTDDALILLQEPMTLKAGQVRQVWVDIDGREAVPGNHTLELSYGDEMLAVPIRVYPRSPLSHPPLVTFNYTYPNSHPSLSDRANEVVLDNKASLINSWLLDRSEVPWPRRAAIDPQGRRDEPLDFSTHDAALRLYEQAGRAQQVGWYWNFWLEHRDPSGGRFEHPYMSDPWKIALAQWLQEWTAHLTQQGYTRERIFMVPYDERGNRKVRDLYRTVKQMQPDLRLALTLGAGQSRRDMRDLKPWLDIAILNRDLLRDYLDVVRDYQADGREVWMYAVLNPAKAKSPEHDYRMLAWEAWALGLQGCSFWAYADVTGDSWDDFDGAHPDFSVVYRDPQQGAAGAESLIPSRRWRAFRLGVQDVQRFAARQAADPGMRQRVDAALLDAAQRPQVLADSYGN